MIFKAAKCPNCSGDLQVPEEKEFVICMYCGSNIKVREAISLKGPNIESILKLADKEYSVNKFNKALELYTKALEIDSLSYKAWLGKGMSSSWNYTLADINFSDLNISFKNALTNAPDNQKEYVKFCVSTNIISRVDDFYKTARKLLDEYSSLDRTWERYIEMCSIMIDTLLISLNFNPNDRNTLDCIIFICQDNLTGYDFIDKFTGKRKTYQLDPERKSFLHSELTRYQNLKN